MSFIYKWGTNRIEVKRKSRCSVRGDLMQVGTHYEENHIACPCTENASGRLLFAIAAADAWPIEHMDIRNS